MSHGPSIGTFQEWVRQRWGQRPKTTDLSVATMGLLGEIAEVAEEAMHLGDLFVAAGRVSEHVKKEIRGSKLVDVDRLKLELGDVQHYLCVLANHYGLDMQDVMGANIRKLEAREAAQAQTAAIPVGA